MAKIFLTGATGLVGSFVAEQLTAQKHHVTCLVRKSSNLQYIRDLPVELVTGSLLEPDSFKDAMKDAEYIFHIAGVTKAIEKSEYYLGNVTGTANLLETAKKVHLSLRRIILVSSQAAVGPSPSARPIDENHPCRPVTDYGQSKLGAEHIAVSYMQYLPITIVRPSSVYGPRDTDVYYFFKNIRKGLNLQVGGTNQLVSLVYVEDLAAGIIAAAFSPHTVNETYFLCEEPPYHWSFVAEVTSDVMQVNYRTIKVPSILASGVAGIIEFISQWQKRPTILNRQKIREVKQPFWAISSQKAKNDFDYQTTFPLREGITKTIRWYEQKGWL